MSKLLTAALILAMSAGAAAAQPGPDQPFHPRLFLSPSGEPFRDGGLEAWFDGADADHDGVLTLPEFKADAMRFFKVLDADGNGVIDGFENQAYETRIAPEITELNLGGRGGGPHGGMRPGGHRGGGHGHRPGGGSPGGVGREGAARFGLLNEPQPIRGADADFSQSVTADEWAKATERRFDHLGGRTGGGLTLQSLRELRAEPAPKPRT